MMEQYRASAAGRELLDPKLLPAANHLASKLRQQEAVSKNMDVVLAQRKQQTHDAVSVALEADAESHHRFALIHWEQLQLDLFLPGHYPLEDQLRAAKTFPDGGTDFEAPMTAAMSLLQKQSFQSTDIVFITDSECSVSESFLEELHQEQAARHFTVTGILLDRGQIGMDFSLKAFCQKIDRTSELLEEAIAHNIIHNL